jgi:hypothetical protein
LRASRIGVGIADRRWQIPHGFWFAGAEYTLVTTISYALTGTDGSLYVTEGGVEWPVTVVYPSS